MTRDRFGLGEGVAEGAQHAGGAGDFAQEIGRVGAGEEVGELGAEVGGLMAGEADDPGVAGGETGGGARGGGARGVEAGGTRGAGRGQGAGAPLGVEAIEAARGAGEIGPDEGAKGRTRGCTARSGTDGAAQVGQDGGEEGCEGLHSVNYTHR